MNKRQFKKYANKGFNRKFNKKDRSFDWICLRERCYNKPKEKNYV